MSRVTYETPPPRRARTGCWVSIFALAVLALCVGGVALAVIYWAGQPNNVQVRAVPSQITLAASEQASVEISIENVGLDPVTVTGIGLDSDLLDAVSVVQMQPAYRALGERNYMFFGDWQEYQLDTIVQPGATLEVTLTLEGVQPGVYNTDLTVWIESDVMGLDVARAARTPLDVEVR